MIVAVVAGYGLVCVAAGFAICRASHRQKGMETDAWSTVHTTLPDPEHVDA